MSSLAPVPSENSTCSNCSAPLVADQRYCLSCGQPASPVRLAFLDVLQNERQPQLGSGSAGTIPVTYAAGYSEPPVGPPWLRRYAPLFAVMSVLLLALTVGLLIGHWVTQNHASTSAQVIKVEGLAGTGAASAGTSTTGTSTTGSSTSAGEEASSSKEEAKEKAEAKKEEEEEEKADVKQAPTKKLSSSDVSKLEKSTGKKHEAELNKLTTAPIEVK